MRKRLRCLIKGHRSTGLFLWWLCDNCQGTCPPSTTKNNRGMADTRWRTLL